MGDVETANLKIRLTEEERQILQGQQGPTLQKAMRTVVLYAEALCAERLVDIEGDGHFVIPWASPGIAPPLEMLDELAAAGLKTKHPFTLDPRSPLEFENLDLTPGQQQKLKQMYRDQDRYDERIEQLGLRDSDAYTCNPYLPEVGNVPKRGSILAWSESACVAYANSVLAARSNRNGAIMDLLCNIVGKTPLCGLLTDEGRRASWLVEVTTARLPHPQLLGAAIGSTVLEGVPFITGLDGFLGAGLGEATRDYLQDMGAGCATYGAVGLFHVENITPEAVEQGQELLLADHATCVLDDRKLQELKSAYDSRWATWTGKPDRCFVGCPHLSLRQLHWWADEIQGALEGRGQSRLAVETLMCTAPQVLRRFLAADEASGRLARAGVKLGTTCVETLFEGDVIAGETVITNSNKLRAYAPAAFFPDETLLEIMVSGRMPAPGKVREDG